MKKRRENSGAAKGTAEGNVVGVRNWLRGIGNIIRATELRSRSLSREMLAKTLCKFRSGMEGPQKATLSGVEPGFTNGII